MTRRPTATNRCRLAVAWLVLLGGIGAVPGSAAALAASSTVREAPGSIRPPAVVARLATTSVTAVAHHSVDALSTASVAAAIDAAIELHHETNQSAPSGTAVPDELFELVVAPATPVEPTPSVAQPSTSSASHEPPQTEAPPPTDPTSTDGLVAATGEMYPEGVTGDLSGDMVGIHVDELPGALSADG